MKLAASEQRKATASAMSCGEVVVRFCQAGPWLHCSIASSRLPIGGTGGDGVQDDARGSGYDCDFVFAGHFDSYPDFFVVLCHALFGVIPVTWFHLNRGRWPLCIEPPFSSCRDAYARRDEECRQYRPVCLGHFLSCLTLQIRARGTRSSGLACYCASGTAVLRFLIQAPPSLPMPNQNANAAPTRINIWAKRFTSNRWAR